MPFSFFASHCRIACIAISLAAGLSVSCAHAADKPYDQRKQECAEIAGGRSYELQNDAMRECTQDGTGKLRATGVEGEQHARAKACDAQAKSVDVQDRSRFLKECYAAKR